MFYQIYSHNSLLWYLVSFSSKSFKLPLLPGILFVNCSNLLFFTFIVLAVTVSEGPINIHCLLKSRRLSGHEHQKRTEISTEKQTSVTSLGVTNMTSHGNLWFRESCCQDTGCFIVSVYKVFYCYQCCQIVHESTCWQHKKWTTGKVALHTRINIHA